MIGNVAIDFNLLYRIAPIDLECINTILWYIIKSGQYVIIYVVGNLTSSKMKETHLIL